MRNTNQRQLTILSANSTEVAPYNSKRVGLVFSAPVAGAYEVRFDGDAALGSGLRITAGQRPFEMWAKDYGDIIQNAIRAIADGANLNAGLMEILQVG